MNRPDSRQPAADEPAVDAETIDDLDPPTDTADVKGGYPCDTCTRTCFGHSLV